MSDKEHGDVSGGEIEIEKSAVRSVRGNSVEVEQSAVALARASEMEFEQSSVLFAVARSMTLEQSGALIVIAPKIVGAARSVLTLHGIIGLVIGFALAKWLSARSKA